MMGSDHDPTGIRMTTLLEYFDENPKKIPVIETFIYWSSRPRKTKKK